MKKLAVLVGTVMCLAGAADATVIMAYTSGVAAVWGAGPGAADPTSQGWTFLRNVNNNTYLGGADSTNGGWRTVDGTSAGYADYSYDLTTDQAASMTNGYRITYTAAVDRHGWTTNNALGSSNYFYPPNNGRQTNNGLWFEGPTYRYSLYFEVNASTNLVVYDGTTRHVIDGSAYESFRSFVVEGTNTTATLTVGLQTFSLTSQAVINDNRILFGSHSSAGQGSAVWNSMTLESVPEPGSAALVLLGFAALLRHRRAAR